MADPAIGNQRQMVYWRLLSARRWPRRDGRGAGNHGGEPGPRLELPTEILDPTIGVDVLLHRYPKLIPHFEAVQRCMQLPEEDASDPSTAGAPLLEPAPDGDGDLRRAFAFSKLLLNVFGPNTRSPSCTAAQYSQWCQDVAAFERCMGLAPGSLRQGSGTPTVGPSTGRGMGPSGHAPIIDDRQLREELVAMESDLVKRMDLREVLKDDRLAAQLTPSMPLLEQLLRDKSNLSGPALANARRLIKKYVDDLAAVLKKQVYSSKSGEIDRSVPPKRVYRNLDLKRTVWKNLHHFNPGDRRVYVDQLFYRQTAQKTLNKYLIVVVDQSGSMVSAMVQCAILASIFSTLPRVVVSLVAFDTNVIDLTPWVADPFEALCAPTWAGARMAPGRWNSPAGSSTIPDAPRWSGSRISSTITGYSR